MTELNSLQGIYISQVPSLKPDEPLPFLFSPQNPSGGHSQLRSRRKGDHGEEELPLTGRQARGGARILSASSLSPRCRAYREEMSMRCHDKRELAHRRSPFSLSYLAVTHARQGLQHLFVINRRDWKPFMMPRRKSAVKHASLFNLYK